MEPDGRFREIRDIADFRVLILCNNHKRLRATKIAEELSGA
jgi:hypothetical protein